MHWPLLGLVHFAAKLKSAVLVSVPATVTVAVCAPYFSCQASIVYVPGGSPLMLKLPSVPDTAKNGCGRTPSHACIQPCTLHSSGTITSGAVNVRSDVMKEIGRASCRKECRSRWSPYHEKKKRQRMQDEVMT